MATIWDVAKYCGTSISTVSNVINGTKYVSPELEERILAAIKELGYEANSVAKSLKSRTSLNVGVIITNIDRIFFTRVIKGIQETMVNCGYRLTFCSTNDSAEMEKTFFKLLCNNWVDGILIDSVAEPAEKRWYEEMARTRVGSKRIPVVSLERSLVSYGIDSVGIDNKRAAMEATSLLREKGCSRIAHITGIAMSPLARERQEGFEEAAGQYACGIEAGDFSPNSGYEAAKRLIAHGSKPDGLFAANDQMAVGAMQALKEGGLRIPEDIKIIGFDDTFVASIITPALSTIHVPKYRMGEQAAVRLLSRINGDTAAAGHIELPFELMDRQTTGTNAVANRSLWKW